MKLPLCRDRPGLFRVAGICSALILSICFSGCIFGQEEAPLFRVTYLSKAHVYTNGGAAEGIQPGITLIVRRNGEAIASLEVTFTSTYSSTCRIIGQRRPIQLGDTTVVQEEHEPKQKRTGQPYETIRKTSTFIQSDTSSSKPIRSPAYFSGSIMYQFYHLNDRTDADLDFTQNNIRLKTHLRNIWGKGYALKVRMRTRHDERTKRYAASVPKQEWRNTIYELSLHNDSDGSRVGFSVGRIIPSMLPGIGYLDGVFLKGRANDSVVLGAFAGTQPEWYSGDFQTSLQKYGICATFTKDDGKKLCIESTLALSGEYHSSIVSRECIHMRHDVRLGGLFRFYQSAAFEFNRDWRKEKAGGSFTLSHLYISLRHRPVDWLGVQLNYDTRTNYWTYEVRSVADSLFNDLLRQGVRGVVTIRLPRNVSVTTSFGIRKRQSDPDETHSYSVRVKKSNWTVHRINLFVRHDRYSSLWSTGSNTAARLGKYVTRRFRVGCEYGRYGYENDPDATRRIRTNDRFRITGHMVLTERICLSGAYQYDDGDTADSRRILLDAGYRF